MKSKKVDPAKEKQCSDCFEIKKISLFEVVQGSRQSICKQCEANWKEKWRRITVNKFISI